MIRVTVSSYEDGVLERVTATGHSFAFAAGENIVCAAATVLLRTAARLLESEADIEVGGGTGSRGTLEFSVRVLDTGKNEFTRTVGEYLRLGIADLQREYPDECALITVQKTGDSHGS